MILSAINTNSAVLNNIVETLQQIKISGVANIPLAIDRATLGTDPELSWDTLTTEQWAGITAEEWDTLADVPTAGYTVRFYTDQSMTDLLFEDDDSTSPDKFTVLNGIVQYTPLDAGLNDGATLSTAKAQGIYYVEITDNAGLNVVREYKNFNNLMFNSVVVSTSDTPTYTPNQNQAVIVPTGERPIGKAVSGDHGHIIASYDIYIRLILPNWSNLSEQQRIIQQQQVGNIVRNALYADRYRGGTCTLYNAQLNGTVVKEFKPLSSDAVLKGVMRVYCAYWYDNNNQF